MKIKPLADRVVVKSVEAEETTKSGIILGNNNCFYPKNHITRGEAVVMIYRAFKACAEEVQ